MTICRMSFKDFNYLLVKVTSYIQKQDTHLRKAITPKERLFVTLLVTGQNAVVE